MRSANVSCLPWSSDSVKVPSNKRRLRRRHAKGQGIDIVYTASACDIPHRPFVGLNGRHAFKIPVLAESEISQISQPCEERKNGKKKKKKKKEQEEKRRKEEEEKEEEGG